MELLCVFDFVWAYETYDGRSGIVRADSEEHAIERVEDCVGDIYRIIRLNDIDSVTNQDYGVVTDEQIEDNLKDIKKGHVSQFMIDIDNDDFSITEERITKILEENGISVRGCANDYGWDTDKYEKGIFN